MSSVTNSLFALMAFLATPSIAQTPKQPTPAATTKQTPPKVPGPTAADGSDTTNPQETNCVKLFEKYAVPLQQLWKKRESSLKPEMTGGYNLIEDFPQNGCRDEIVRKSIIELLAKILNSHSGKIGVILPLSTQPYLRHFIASFEALIRSHQADPQNVLVIADTHGKSEKVLPAVASMIFQHKVTAIIGGTEPNEASILAEWAPKLAIPTFLVMEPARLSLTPFVYYAHPTQTALARAAAAANIQFGHKRVAILSPLDQHSDKFINEYERIAKEQNLNVSPRFFYDSKRYDSMEAAARKLLRLEATERRDELKQLYESAKNNARATKTPFNPKMVALQPDIRFDAIMIPDTFKVVRHFAKILTFLGARKLPLFGHFEWRSPGILQPWDHFLNGSYFVDFQGSYIDLPNPLKLPTTISPYFVAADKIEQADFSLVAWRAMETPFLLTSKLKEPRRKLEKFIPIEGSGTDVTSFDQNHVMIWRPTTFMLSTSGPNAGQLSTLSQPPSR